VPGNRLRAWLERALVNLALFGLSTILSVGLVFGVGELVLRLRPHDPRWAPWAGFHPVRGWALQPGEYTRYDLNESQVTHLSINALGMRNPQVSLKVPAGRRRISVLGDSFVFSAVLNEPETMVGQLRKALGPDREVVDLGVEGYGTGQEILFAEELASRGFDLGDEIVLVFFTNDILDNVGLAYGTGQRQPACPVFSVDSAGTLHHTAPVHPYGNPWQSKLTRTFLFYRFLRTRAANLATSHPWILRGLERLGFHVGLPRTPGVIEGFYSPGWPERWKTTADLLNYLARESRDRFQARLLVVYMPSPFQVVGALEGIARRQGGADSVYAAFFGDVDRPQRLLSEVCTRCGVPFIDATVALREAARRKSPYFIYEGHLNPWGSQVVATVIHRALETPVSR